MITLISDRSQVTQKSFWGLRRTVWKINRDTVLADNPSELEMAAYACHHHLVRLNGSLYAPLNSKKVKHGQTIRFIDDKPYILVKSSQNKNK